MKLYNFPQSINGRKVESLIKHLGLTIDRHEIDFFGGEMRKPEFLAINPNAKAPALQDGDMMLWESQAILLYIASLNPSSNLLPTDPKGRANVDRWLFWNSSHFEPHIVSLCFEHTLKQMLNLGGPNQHFIDAAVANFNKAATILDSHLKDNEYVCGGHTVVDYAMYPWCDAAGMGKISFSDYPNIAKWLERVHQLKGYIPMPSM
ncbi:MAG: glutathione S-transferase family protein [Proteobacteria bacterium]|nr:glutathione S-transferase family protein [Pseudomonadota bacterium]